MSAKCPARGDTQTFDLKSEADTVRLGERLADCLSPGDWLCLSGPLGSGKTALARAIIQARMGRSIEVPSPTYTLVNVFGGKVPIWHADLYRLSGDDDLEELGLIDGNQDRIVLLEWPERLGRNLPVRRLEVELSFDGNGRCAQVTRVGGVWSIEQDAN
ncbi:MAG: tRNA (adenosine(37)-N6)-threonylcarbamoyltransferase complex ATPase subunit type 1 TsaE [Pseudomonadota bacterium]